MELNVKKRTELTKTRKKLELNRQRLLVLSPQRLRRTAGGQKTTVDDGTSDGTFDVCDPTYGCSQPYITCTYH
jgi:hypothetical protein